MADIRDVESLRNYLFRKADDDNTNNPYKIARIHAYRDAFERLLASPIITAAPKHGRWTGINRNRYNDDEATCSICGATFASGYSNPSWWDYCPNCGSIMDEPEAEP